LGAWREKPAGTIRIPAADYALEILLWPKLTKFLAYYPDIKVEVVAIPRLPQRRVSQPRGAAALRFAFLR
jgi:hypothetical protein